MSGIKVKLITLLYSHLDLHIKVSDFPRDTFYLPEQCLTLSPSILGNR